MNTDTDTDTDTIDRLAIRKTIGREVRESDDAPARADVLDAVATAAGIPREIVADELDALERAGFVYLVGDVPVVKVP